MVKNYLQLYYWKNNEFFELRPQIRLPDVARVVVWCTNLLCVGLRGQYVQVCLNKGTVKELFSVTSDPMIIPLVAENGLALCREKQTYIFDNESKPLLDYAITWSELPVAISEDLLFILAIESNSQLEVITNAVRGDVSKVWNKKHRFSNYS